MAQVKFDEGVKASEVEEGRKMFGENKVEEEPQEPLYMLMWGALQDPTLIFLTCAAFVSLAIGIFVANSFGSPYFLNAWNLTDATFNFTEKAMIAFAMALLIIPGEIDL